MTEENLSVNRTYYSLSYNDRPSDKTSLTFKASDCPTGEVLKVKCKDLECGIRTQVPSQARYCNMEIKDVFSRKDFIERIKCNILRAKWISHSKNIFSMFQDSRRW